MSGQIDVMWTDIAYTPERAKRLDFVTYMDYADALLVPKGNPKNVRSIDDLCGLRVSATVASVDEPILRKRDAACTAAGKKGVDVILAPDQPGTLRLVTNGRADALLSDENFINSAVAADSSTQKAFRLLNGMYLAAGIAKNKPDLVKAIADGLQVIRSNGVMRQIFDRYGVDYALSVDPVVMTH